MNIKGYLPGIISVELGLGILATVTVLFVIISNFNENLNNIAMKNGMNNFFSKNEEKTAYYNYNRDYTNLKIYFK